MERTTTSTKSGDVRLSIEADSNCTDQFLYAKYGLHVRNGCMQEVLESPRGKFEFKLTTMTICIAGLVAACDSFSILAHFIGYGLELQIL